MPEIIIDKNKCIGCGTCVAIAQNVFAIGEDMKAEVIDQNGDSPETVELAKKSCPVGAIDVK
jgi:ferredoxin